MYLVTSGSNGGRSSKVEFRSTDINSESFPEFLIKDERNLWISESGDIEHRRAAAGPPLLGFPLGLPLGVAVDGSPRTCGDKSVDGRKRVFAIL